MACVLSGRAASGCIAMAASYLSVAFARFFSIVASSSDSSSGVLGGVDISGVVENAPPRLHSPRRIPCFLVLPPGGTVGLVALHICVVKRSLSDAITLHSVEVWIR